MPSLQKPIKQSASSGKLDPENENVMSPSKRCRTDSHSDTSTEAYPSRSELYSPTKRPKMEPGQEDELNKSIGSESVTDLYAYPGRIHTTPKRKAKTENPSIDDEQPIDYSASSGLQSSMNPQLPGVSRVCTPKKKIRSTKFAHMKHLKEKIFKKVKKLKPNPMPELDVPKVMYKLVGVVVHDFALPGKFFSMALDRG